MIMKPNPCLIRFALHINSIEADNMNFSMKVYSVVATRAIMVPFLRYNNKRGQGVIIIQSKVIHVDTSLKHLH